MNRKFKNPMGTMKAHCGATGVGQAVTPETLKNPNLTLYKLAKGISKSRDEDSAAMKRPRQSQNETLARMMKQVRVELMYAIPSPNTIRFVIIGQVVETPDWIRGPAHIKRALTPVHRSVIRHPHSRGRLL